MTSDPNPASKLFAPFLLSVGVVLVGNLLVRMGRQADFFPQWLGVVFAVAAVGPLLLVAVRFRRSLTRGLDELVQRIVLEGFAFALLVWLPLAALYVNLRSAGAYVPRLDPPDILMLPAVLVGLGLWRASRRYT